MIIATPTIGFFYLLAGGIAELVAPQGLYQLLGTNGLTEFQQSVDDRLSIQDLLNRSDKALTVFAPSNDAIYRWRAKSNPPNVMTSDFLENHIAKGAYTNSKLQEIAHAAAKQERKLASISRNSPLWIKHFPAETLSKRQRDRYYVNNALLTLDQPQNAALQYLYIIDDVLEPIGADVTAHAFLENPAKQMHPNLALEDLKQEVDQMSHFAALQDVSSVFTFFLPSNVAFSSLKNRGALDASTLTGHIISDEIVFLRSLEDDLFEAQSAVSVSSISPNRKSVNAFESLLNGGSSGMDCFLGFGNISAQQQVYSLVTNTDGKYSHGRVYGNIVKANIPVKNGVIHVIDRILLVVEQNALEIIQSRRDLHKFLELFNLTDRRLLERLSTDIELTIFIPTESALAALPTNKLSALKKDTHLLERILNLHILHGRLTSDAITNTTNLLAASSQSLTFQVGPLNNGNAKQVSVEGDGVRARIIEPDVASTNAIIHVIDQVLGVQFMNTLEKLRAEPSLSRTYKAFEQTKQLYGALISTTTNCTLFAPSDQAWLKMNDDDRKAVMGKTHILAKVLKRHLVESRRMESTNLRREDPFTTTFSDVIIKKGNDVRDTVLVWRGHSARVTTYDIVAVNGVIHVIDQVLFDREFDLVNKGCTNCFVSMVFVTAISISSLLLIS